MTTTPLSGALEATPFPGPGVAAGIQRAGAAAWVTGPRLVEPARLDGADRPSGAGRIVDLTFAARRLHVVRLDSLRCLAPVVGPSVPA